MRGRGKLVVGLVTSMLHLSVHYCAELLIVFTKWPNATAFSNTTRHPAR